MALSKGNIILIGLGTLAAGAVFYFSYSQRRKVLKISQAFIGQMEKSGNSGFQNAEMEKLMKEVGWRPGDAWCVYFAKLMWYMQAPNWLKPKIKTAISGNSQTTWDNVSKDPAFVVSRIPRPGDLVIWQNFKNGVGSWTGHAGIVKKVNLNDFTTVEGNTNDAGGSEGVEVAEKVRKYDFTRENGLRLKGFVRFA
jgi:hypothetical protein